MLTAVRENKFIVSFTELFGGTLSFATETADSTVEYSDVSAADADEPDSKLPSRAVRFSLSVPESAQLAVLMRCAASALQ